MRRTATANNMSTARLHLSTVLHMALVAAACRNYDSARSNASSSSRTLNRTVASTAAAAAAACRALLGLRFPLANAPTAPLFQATNAEGQHTHADCTVREVTDLQASFLTSYYRRVRTRRSCNSILLPSPLGVPVGFLFSALGREHSVPP
eukprot:SAG31_NODE_11775_length_999_cov_1.382222_1_plen_149_part_10